MGELRRRVRRNVLISAEVAERVRALANVRKTSANRVLVEFIEVGLQTTEAEKKRFIVLASRLADASKAAERRWLKQELARTTFGG